MKSVLLLIPVMLLIVPCIVSAGTDNITFTEIDDLIYQFDYSVDNATSYRWSFGDGATSTEISPVHEYSNHKTYNVACDITFSDGSVISDSATLDATLPLVDGDTGNVNVGDVSVPGGLLFISSFLMFALAKSGNHIGADILGKGGKDVMLFLYTLGMVAGFYLIASGYYGVG